MRRVVSDTGPILHLCEADALHLLRLTGDVAVPPTVDEELERLMPSWAAIRPPWLPVEPLTEAARQDAHGWSDAGLLDPGEAAALSLARQLQAGWFVTDDTAARVIASRLGLEVHGSLGIVLWAAAVGHLQSDEARRHLESVFRSSLWVSPRVRAEARAALDALFET